MMDEGGSLREPPGAGVPGGQAQEPGGERGAAADAGAEGARMGGTGPQDDAGPVAPDDPRPPGGPESPGPPGRSASAGTRGAHASGRQATQRRAAKRSFLSLVRELLILVAVALFLTLVIETYGIQTFWIPSGSMENTLEIGDRVLVNKLAFDFGSIHRGDVIVFSGDGSWNPGTPLPSRNFFARFAMSAESMFGSGPDRNDYIKRVIGLPGDHVACCNSQGDVTVNGVPLHEQSYLYPGNPPSMQRFSVIVPPGHLWVMGDHRSVSYDSRGHMSIDGDHGTIPENAVVGRAFVIIWPLSQWRALPIPATFDRSALNGPKGSAQASGASRSTSAIPIRRSGSPVPLALGFAGAVPVTLLQRKLRVAARRRRRARRDTART